MNVMRKRGSRFKKYHQYFTQGYKIFPKIVVYRIGHVMNPGGQMSVYMYVCMVVCVYICLKSVHVRVCLYVCMCVYACVCMHVCAVLKIWPKAVKG